ncbi:11732_t:CDS:2 [Ambispora gerdemannii]|uniref:11732_t:CDS:1 n=1 Tax=Ambispora gerdemannii TaxID=144530 RepID=A0A9N9A6D9_9GLOM|nr:11732_t:CDS:2 [Ambispora gerdemannii]
MATTTPAADAGSKNWLKERAAISAAHRRQKTDPAAARLIEKADQLHKERTHRHLREPLEGDEKDEVERAPVESIIEEETDGEDIDAIVNVPPPEEIVVKEKEKDVVRKDIDEDQTENQTNENISNSAETTNEEDAKSKKFESSSLLPDDESTVSGE